MVNPASSHSYGQTQSTSSVIICDRLRRKLGWARLVWLAVCTVLSQQGKPIVDIKLRDPNSLRLCNYHKYLEDVHFYEIIYGNRDEKDIESHPENTASAIDDDLLKGAVTLSYCSKGVYILWDKIHLVLKDEPENIQIRWMRNNIRPQRVFVSSTSKIVPIYQHDYFVLRCMNGEEFILDIAPDQFGYSEWLYAKEEYDQIIETSLLPPGTIHATQQIAEMEQKEPDLIHLKAAIDEIIDEIIADHERKWVEEDWNWSNIDTAPRRDLDQMYSNLASDIKKKIMRLFDSLQYSQEEAEDEYDE